MNYKAFHKLTYGLYIIASEYNGQKAGYIANAAFQVTAEPALIAISCHKENNTTEIINKSGVFSISVLKKEIDTSIIGEFGFMSSNDFDKFSKIKYEVYSTGAPVIIEASVAWFDCKVVRSVDVGSHILFIGEVVVNDIISDEEPLTYSYYREKYRMLAPKNAPTYIASDKLESKGEEVEIKDDAEKKISAEETDKDKVLTCTICGFSYDPEEGDPSVGIPPGTPFDELPDDYKCPICNAGKEYFH